MSISSLEMFQLDHRVSLVSSTEITEILLRCNPQQMYSLSFF